jgi:hypothetical protein
MSIENPRELKPKIKPYRPSTFLMGDFELTPQEKSVYRAFGRFFKKMRAQKESTPVRQNVQPADQEKSD